jgi:hypothetical protein
VIKRCFAFHGVKRALGLLLFILAVNCPADSVRVVTWNLEPSSADRASERKALRPAEAAAVLNPLAPDVILLQQAPDWQACAELAQALKSGEYRVLACSAFRDPRTANLGQQQVAILSKHRAYVSWSRPWAAVGDTTLPGGVAFAAIRVRGQRLGFFSVQPGDESNSPRQLVAQVTAVKRWVTNQVQLFIVGGAFDADRADQPATPPETLRLLQEAGFANVFLQTPALGQLSVRPGSGQVALQGDCLFTQPPGCATNPHILSNTIALHNPVACDLEIDPAWIAAAWVNQSTAASAGRVSPSDGTKGSLRSRAEPAVAQSSSLSPQLKAALAVAMIVALIAVAWAVVRRTRTRFSKTPGLLTDGVEGAPASYTVIVGTQSGTGPPPPAAAAPARPQPIIHVESPGDTHTQAQVLQRRAQAAEERAERATAALRTGVIHQMSRWLKQKLVRRLIVDRAQLMEAQQAATERALSVEERLARVERQIQQQTSGYQLRIEELTRELLAAKEENRELIRAQIRQVKAEMEAARARLLVQTRAEARG